tara:strand:- start:43 stop:2028 length:1986 start_codon:yes stop_codon:yes gene_type:complete
MRYAKFGQELSQRGFDVTPLRGKIPQLVGWQHRPDAALDWDKWGDANIGVVLGGKHNLIAIDIDVRSAKAANVIRQLADDILGSAPERIGSAPKTLLVYRCTEPVRKIKTSIFEINGDACVECLAEGQQFVASGLHPDTHKNYSWPNDSLLDYRPEELTALTPGDITSFIATCNEALAGFGDLKSRSQTNVLPFDSGSNFDFQESDTATSMAKLAAAVPYLENPGLHYDDWVRLAHAFKAAVGDDGLALFHEFSQKSDKYEYDETERLWASIGSVSKIGAGSLFHLAAEGGFDIANWDRKFGPADIAEEEIQITPAKDATDGSFTAASVVGPIPPREWVLDGWFPQRTVGMLFGAGGVGKTLLMQQFANAVAEGEQFLSIDTMKMPVLSVMCEDDADEVKRRQLKINEARGIDEFGDGPENLVLWPRVGSDNVLVTWPNGGNDEPGEFYRILCEKVVEVKGDDDSILVILDTAADMFGGNENERRTVNTFLKTYLGSIVINYNATVILLAHPSLSGLKGSGLSGSTAWENSVRSRSYLSREEDSDDIRVLSRKKSNYSDISGDSDIKLIWENGVLAIPSSPDALDRINSTALKHAIMSEVDIAWGERNGIRKQGPRGYKTALPSLLKQHKSGAVIKAFHALVADGNVMHVERFGYKTEKSI